MFDQAYFNFHDIVLILIFVESVLFSLILISVHMDKLHSRVFLSLFLLTKALVAFDALIYWCIPLKSVLFSDQYRLFFVFKFALLIQGPLLFLYVKSLIYSDFKLVKKDIFHFVPLLLFPILYGLIINDIGPDDLYAGIDEYNFYFSSGYFRFLLNAQSVSILLYSIMSLYILVQYRKNITARFSEVDSISLAWIALLVIAYLVLWGFELSAQIAHQFDLGELAAFVGLSKNYVELIFINLLVVYAVVKVAQPTAFINEQDSENLLDNLQQNKEDGVSCIPDFNQQDVDKVVQSMVEHEYFLEHDINIEKLADKIGVNTRIVSKVINQSFNQNFFEFINGYRVEKAKFLLEKSVCLSMLEIMDLSGFNSKSTFNRLFKKQTGLTPSQYRLEKSLPCE
ncbi:helix-turn-helix domain-containing protein [Marinicellulosiphila megalodicopiae]|uniref:helix-turn-helix domain-containing protein n=1 Tax=Marinicellulosiphila megalodicopiae TaxID=2724896 RepID=UPI003BAF675C